MKAVAFRSILIVEDDEATRTLLATLLGEDPPPQGGTSPDQATRGVLARLRLQLAPYWPILKGRN